MLIQNPAYLLDYVMAVITSKVWVVEAPGQAFREVQIWANITLDLRLHDFSTYKSVREFSHLF